MKERLYPITRARVCGDIVTLMVPAWQVKPWDAAWKMLPRVKR